MGFSSGVANLLPLFLLFLAHFAALGGAAFNCTRVGTGCYNGGVCDGATGGCVCIGSTFTGYDCAQDHKYIMQGACLSHNPCENGGTCYDLSVTGGTGSALCYCPHDFYGKHCHLPTVQNECFHDQMVVNVYPGYNFVGIVGIQHKAGICDLSPVSSQVEFSLDPVRSQWQGFAAVLPFSGAMCGVGPKVTTKGAEMTYSYDVIVRYDRSGRTPELDEIITFSCAVPNVGGPIAGPTAVLFSIMGPTGAIVEKPKVGSPITVTFKVDPASIFTDLAVKSCHVTNSRKSLTQPVVIESCPVRPVATSLVKMGAEHQLTFLVHTLGRDPVLSFQCSVKVCMASDVSCQLMPVCPPSLQSVGVTPTPANTQQQPPTGAAGAGGALTFNDLLAPTSAGLSTAESKLWSQLQSGPTGTSSMTASAPSTLDKLLGASSMTDLLLNAGPSSFGSSGPVVYRKRRDVNSDVIVNDGDSNVVIVTGSLW